MNLPPEVIAVRMLSDFSLSYQGNLLHLERTNSTKAMQALQVLLYCFPEGISRERLMDILYADDTAADPANNLKVTISNLRRLLTRAGLPESVTIRYKTGSYFFCSDLPVVLDVRQFEEELAKAKACREEEDKLTHLRQAAQLYTGDFLPHLMGSDWAVIAAAQLRQSYFACVRTLAELLSRRNEWEALLELATHTAALYHMEEWQCLRIDCLMALERYNEAKQVYDQAVYELSEEFDVKPSDELIQRFRQLSLAGQENTETVAQITDHIQEPQRQSGAYYCSYPSFIDVYRMCCRMMERSGQSAYLLMYWLCDSRGRLLEDPEKIAAAQKLKAAIGRTLRRGDAYTQHGRDRFLVLLIGTNRENCSIVDKRIEKNYREDSAWGVSIRHSLHMAGDASFSPPDSGAWHPAP